VTSCKRTSELRRPQFDILCGADESHDHNVELQVAKAFLNQDNKTSLSCETIRWLNSGVNVRCVSKSVNAEKGQFFKMLMEKVKVESCTKDEKWIMRRQVQCFMNGAVRCGNPASCYRQPVLRIGTSCCCDGNLAQGNNLLPSNCMAYTGQLHEDFAELGRFLEFKLKVFCAGVENVTSSKPGGAPTLHPRAYE
jgi:hypothetical protein